MTTPHRLPARYALLSLASALGLLVLAGSGARAADPDPFVWVRTVVHAGTVPNGAVFGIAFDPSGNVLAAGRTSGGGAREFTVAKFAPDGTELWVRTLPGPNSGATAVATDGQGSVFAAGGRTVDDVFQSVVAKWSADGVPQWTATFSPDAITSSFGTSLVIDSAGNAIAGGSVNSGSGSGDWAVAKFRGADGSTAWVRRGQGIAGFGSNSIQALAIDSGNHVAAAGYGQTGGGPFGFLVMRLNGNTGVPFWSLFDGDPNAYDQASSVAIAPGDHVIAGGFFTEGVQRVFTVAKYQRDTGARLWINQSAGQSPSGVGASSVAVNSQGNPVAAGITETVPRNHNVAAAAFSGDTGATLWRTLALPAVDNGFAFADDGVLDPQDRLVAAGGRGGYTPFFEDFAAWQFSPNGALVSTRILPSHGDGEALTVATDLQGNAVVGGYHTPADSEDVQFTVAYLGPAGSGTSRATHFKVTAPAGVNAGESFGFTLTALDAANAPVTDYTGTVHFTSSDLQAALPADYTFTASDSGAHGFMAVLKTSGNETLIATDTAVPSRRGNATVTVAAGAAVKLAFEQQPTHTNVNSAINPPVTVRIVDPFDNVVTSATHTVTLALASNPGGAVLGGTRSVAAVNGVASFSTLTLDHTGTGYTLTATAPDLAGPFPPSTPFDVTAKPATHFRVTAPAAAIINSPFQVTVTALDVDEQTVSTYTGAVHWTVTSDPAAALPADYTFAAGDSGTRAFSVTLKTPGSKTVTVTDKAAPSIRGSVVINVSETGSLVVTTAADTVSGADGFTSLREAILFANALPGRDTISFKISGNAVKTLSPTSPLPTITDPVIIDGFTQPGSKANTLTTGNNAGLRIEISGALAGAGVDGLTITAGGSTLRGLVIDRFRDVAGPGGVSTHGSGVRLEGGVGNTILGCYLGTSTTGGAVQPNRGDGITVLGGSRDNVIGGTTPAGRNVISGNLAAGIRITGAETTGNTVQGSYIGTNAVGAKALPNGTPTSGGTGVLIESSGNRVGGALPGARNLISGNRQYGVFLDGATTTGNHVQGNYLGTNAAGSSDLGNFAGVAIRGGTDNTVGGDTPGTGNLISGNASGGIALDGAAGNRVQGNRIGTNLAGTRALPNGTSGVILHTGASNNLIGGEEPGARNVISGNGQSGVFILDTSTGNQILGNFIGTNAAGSAGVGNGNGVTIANASNNQVGGVTPAAGNVLSGNVTVGVVVVGGSATGNRVQGNRIGTNALGSAAVPNRFGAAIGAASANTIGGTEAGAGNLISGNTDTGVQIERANATDPVPQQNQILGNVIGLNAAGSAALPNGTGVKLWLSSANNRVGGALPGARNLISGNRLNGVLLSSVGTTGNQVQGNYIGTNLAGTAAFPNGASGIQIDISAPANLIGGDFPGGGNLISGNKLSGVRLDSSGNLVQGNWIGLNAAGTGSVPNGIDGVFITGANNRVGGANPQSGNVISGNGSSGVGLISGAIPASGNVVQGNRIGTDPGGTRAVGNDVGVFVFARNNVVGGTDPGAGNLISGNRITGVQLGDVGTQVQGNRIGTDLAGVAAIPNKIGLQVSGSSNTVGGVQADAGNLISGNTQQGVVFSGSLNLLLGNFIGTNVAGTAALPNGDSGVSVTGPNNLIGGVPPGAGNLVSGNLRYGIWLNGKAASGNWVQGNRVGTDVSGTFAVRAPSMFPHNGIQIEASRNLIGGAAPGAGNLVSGNPDAGLHLFGNWSDNVVLGNRIGTDALGTSAVPNRYGIVITSGTGHTLGGAAMGEGNRIAFNQEQGILNVTGTQIWIRGNNISSNGKLGIDLTGANAGPDGVNPNDALDKDKGANAQQNYPVLTGVTVNGDTVTLTGTLNSLPKVRFVVDFYRSSAADPSGFGEGEVYLGSVNLVTTSAGSASFNATLPAGAAAAGQYFTATASRDYGTGYFETSEFSRSFQAP